MRDFIYVGSSPNGEQSVPPCTGKALPIDIVLHCPACGLQHVDAPEPGETRYEDGLPYTPPGWTNPPHKSHLCHGCGHIWRPADVPTNGVAAIKTKGKADDAAPTQRTQNQCDGCARGLPLIRGLHRGTTSGDLQSCTAHLYAAPSAPEQAPAQPVAEQTERERFEAWAVAILGDNPNWRESGPGELAWQAWQAARAAPALVGEKRKTVIRTVAPTYNALTAAQERITELEAELKAIKYDVTEYKTIISEQVDEAAADRALLVQARDALELLRKEHWMHWPLQHCSITAAALAALDARLGDV